MEYEQVKVIILARLKQWKEAQEIAHDTKDTGVAYFSLGQVQTAGYFCKAILQDLETAFSILEKDNKEA